MTNRENLQLYLELINCNYDLFLWEYDGDLNFLQTNWTESVFAGNFVSYTGLAGLVKEHIASGKRAPTILEAPANLMWMAGFDYDEDTIKACYFIGPIYSGRDSHLMLRKNMDSYDLSIKLRSSITKIFEQIPTLPSNILSQYAIMFHYALTGERITDADLTFQSTIPAPAQASAKKASTEHAGIWYTEQQLLKAFADGSPNYKEALRNSSSLSSGVKAETGDALRQHKNSGLVLLTLCSRACIKGGLAPEIAYDLNDYYATRLEECASLTAVRKLLEEMLEDYVLRVQQAKESSDVSTQIQNACTFIKGSVTTPLSIKTLAQRYGYSEYYFSHKFHKEVGISVNEYILKERISQAKLLLAGTSDSIQSISDTLLFGNRSYFYTCFRKEVGVSPSEYRQNNQKI